MNSIRVNILYNSINYKLNYKLIIKREYLKKIERKNNLDKIV